MDDLHLKEKYENWLGDQYMDTISSAYMRLLDAAQIPYRWLIICRKSRFLRSRCPILHAAVGGYHESAVRHADYRRKLSAYQ